MPILFKCTVNISGLTNKKLGQYEEALDSLLKMHAVVRNYPPVVYQIAHLYQLLEDNDQASEWWVVGNYQGMSVMHEFN